MKIEIGESLILSWLKHVRGCQVVQMNWKVSKSWKFLNQDILEDLMQRSQLFFSDEYDYDIFRNSGFQQLINQGESDVVGIRFNEAETLVIAVDVAFHESGLNYGERKVTVARVVKKCLRTVFSLLGCLNISYGEIIFASPKINSRIKNDIEEAIAHLNRILKSAGLDYNVRLLCNEDFHEEIIIPVLEQVKTVADTSELFMRGIQMYQMFYSIKPVSATKSNDSSKDLSQESVAAMSKEDPVQGYEDLKVGQIARFVLAPLIQTGVVDSKEFNKLQDLEYSKKTFGLTYPLLRKAQYDESRPMRYYSKPTIRFGETVYYLCSEWYETPGNNDRPLLIKWITEHS